MNVGVYPGSLSTALLDAQVKIQLAQTGVKNIKTKTAHFAFGSAIEGTYNIAATGGATLYGTQFYAPHAGEHLHRDVHRRQPGQRERRAAGGRDGLLALHEARLTHHSDLRPPTSGEDADQDLRTRSELEDPETDEDRRGRAQSVNWASASARRSASRANILTLMPGVVISMVRNSRMSKHDQLHGGLRNDVRGADASEQQRQLPEVPAWHERLPPRFLLRRHAATPAEHQEELAAGRALVCRYVSLLAR